MPSAKVQAMHLEPVLGHPFGVAEQFVSPACSLTFYEQLCFLLLGASSEEGQNVEKKAKDEIPLDAPGSVRLVPLILGNYVRDTSWPSFLKKVDDFKVSVAKGHEASGISSHVAADCDGTFPLEHAGRPRKIAIGPAWTIGYFIFKLRDLFGNVLCAVPALREPCAFSSLGIVFVWHNRDAIIFLIKRHKFLAHLVRPDGQTIYESIQKALVNDKRLLLAAEPEGEQAEREVES